jgi:hypothetical protein
LLCKSREKLKKVLDFAGDNKYPCSVGKETRKPVMLPPDLHYRFKVAAVGERVTMSTVLRKLIEDWLRKKGHQQQ